MVYLPTWIPYKSTIHVGRYTIPYPWTPTTPWYFEGFNPWKYGLKTLKMRGCGFPWILVSIYVHSSGTALRKQKDKTSNKLGVTLMRLDNMMLVDEFQSIVEWFWMNGGNIKSWKMCPNHTKSCENQSISWHTDSESAVDLLNSKTPNIYKQICICKYIHFIGYIQQINSVLITAHLIISVTIHYTPPFGLPDWGTCATDSHGKKWGGTDSTWTRYLHTIELKDLQKFMLVYYVSYVYHKFGIYIYTMYTQNFTK